MRTSAASRSWFLSALALASMLGALACGLVSSDIATITFDLPAKTYSFDTASAGWTAPPATFPEVACGDGQPVTDCCAPPAPLPQPDCAATPLICDAGVCVMRTVVEQVQTIDLGREVPALANQTALADVTISRVRYEIPTNTMNVALPATEVYVAPQGVTSSADPQARLFGTVPSIPAGSTAGGDVALAPEGQAAFAERARTPATPFNIVTRTIVTVRPGEPVPSGRLDIVIRAQLSARPSL